MSISINEIFKKYNCNKISSESYCEENLIDYPEVRFSGLKALVHAQKYYENPASIETINDRLHLSRIIFDYDEESLIYKFNVSRYGDCISNFKLKLLDSQNKELIFSDYIDKLWLNINNNNIESDMLSSEKLFTNINYNNPLNILGLSYSEILLNIKFNDYVIEKPFSQIIVYIDYIYLTNKLRYSLIKNNTSFTNNCNNYIVSEGTLKKQNDIVPDYFHLFTTRIIEPKIKAYAIIPFYSEFLIQFKIDANIKYISIYPTEKCNTNFDKFLQFNITYSIISYPKCKISYKFYSHEAYTEFKKCHSNLIFFISEL